MNSSATFSPSVIGADVHKKNIVCCARRLVDNEWQESIETFGTTKRELLRMGEWCHQFSPSFVLLESTGVYWMSPYKYLERAGLQVYIVNPRSVKGMIGNKTDTKDAAWLAQKGNEGSFKPSYIPSEEWRRLRDLSRNIIMLTQEYTRLKNREIKMFTAMGFRLESVFTDSFGVNASRAKDAILAGKSPLKVLACVDVGRIKANQEILLEAFDGDLDDDHVRVIATNRRIMDVIEAEVTQNKNYILTEVEKREPQLFDLFQTIPGIDEYHAATLVIEFGGSAFIRAFAKVERFASWLGMNPGLRESGGKRKPFRSGHGNWAARRCLCEAAHAGSHANGSTIQSRYHAQRARIGIKKAVISAAHYIAKMTYIVAKRQHPYVDPSIDYEAAAFDRAFTRYVKKAIQYKEKWSVNVENRETGERYQSPDTATGVTPTSTRNGNVTSRTNSAGSQSTASNEATATEGRSASTRRTRRRASRSTETSADSQSSASSEATETEESHATAQEARNTAASADAQTAASHETTATEGTSASTRRARRRPSRSNEASADSQSAPSREATATAESHATAQEARNTAASTGTQTAASNEATVTEGTSGTTRRTRRSAARSTASSARSQSIPLNEAAATDESSASP